MNSFDHPRKLFAHHLRHPSLVFCQVAVRDNHDFRLFCACG